MKINKINIRTNTKNYSIFIGRSLIKERSKVYELSDYKINCDKLDKVQIINKILDIYENK